jgi:hypothetical protein
MPESKIFMWFTVQHSDRVVAIDPAAVVAVISGDRRGEARVYLAGDKTPFVVPGDVEDIIERVEAMTAEPENA